MADGRVLVHMNSLALAGQGSLKNTDFSQNQSIHKYVKFTIQFDCFGTIIFSRPNAACQLLYIKSPWNQNWLFLFFMEYRSVYNKRFICAHRCFTIHVPRNLESATALLCWCGQGNLSLKQDPPIANHQSNHPINSPDEIKPSPTNVLVEKTFATSVSCCLYHIIACEADMAIHWFIFNKRHAGE